MHNEFSVYVEIVVYYLISAKHLKIKSVKIKFKHNIKAIFIYSASSGRMLVRVETS